MERKKKYEKPVMFIQKFVPDEYVAACYQLACRRGSCSELEYGWHWNTGERGNVSHSALGTPDTCGDADANRVITDEGGFFQSVGEYNGQQGWLNGGLDYVLQRDGNNTVDPGDVIFWHTTSRDGRKWNHYGVVEQQDSEHPNHS